MPTLLLPLNKHDIKSKSSTIIYVVLGIAIPIILIAFGTIIIKRKCCRINPSTQPLNRNQPNPYGSVNPPPP